jgi:hypothetical protein
VSPHQRDIILLIILSKGKSVMGPAYEIIRQHTNRRGVPALGQLAQIQCPCQLTRFRMVLVQAEHPDVPYTKLVAR